MPEGLTSFIEDQLALAAEQRFRPARGMAVTYGYSFARTRVGGGWSGSEKGQYATRVARQGLREDSSAWNEQRRDERGDFRPFRHSHHGRVRMTVS